MLDKNTKYSEGIYKCPICGHEIIIGKGDHLMTSERHCSRCNVELKLIKEKEIGE